MSGYGQTGPLRDLPGHDLNYQARAGIVEPRGRDAELPVARPPLADLAGGVYAAMAICAALLRVARGGAGEYIDVAMTDVLATWTGPLPSLTVEGGPVLRGGGVAGYGSFHTADGGWIALGVLAVQPLWEALTRSLGMASRTALTFVERLEMVEELNAEVAAAVGAMTRDEAVTLLADAGAAVSPVLGQAELGGDDNLRARGLVAQSADGRTTMAHPVHYRTHPAQTPTAVPPLVSGVESTPTWAATTTSR